MLSASEKRLQEAISSCEYSRPEAASTQPTMLSASEKRLHTSIAFSSTGKPRAAAKQRVMVSALEKRLHTEAKVAAETRVGIKERAANIGRRRAVLVMR